VSINKQKRRGTGTCKDLQINTSPVDYLDRSWGNYLDRAHQIVRSGGRLVYRLLSWNPWLGVFRRLANELRC
jgi:hypothetical protein